MWTIGGMNKVNGWRTSVGSGARGQSQPWPAVEEFPRLQRWEFVRIGSNGKAMLLDCQVKQIVVVVVGLRV